MEKYISGEEAVKAIKSGNRVFVHGGAATPHFLLRKLVERASELYDVELVSISMQGEALFTDPRYRENFHINSLFVSANVREAVNDGRGDYVPVFLSEIPNLFRRNTAVGCGAGTSIITGSPWVLFIRRIGRYCCCRDQDSEIRYCAGKSAHAAYTGRWYYKDVRL